jgi:hypothetical protein
MIDYDLIWKKINAGESLNAIAKELKIDSKNMRVQLKKKFGFEAYADLIYGKVISTINGQKLRKLPQKQTNFCESNITKRAKAILSDVFDCQEEVGVWFNDFKTRSVIDLYSKKHNLGIELYWKSGENYKKLKTKLLRYCDIFDHVAIALLKDSSFKQKNRSYINIKNKLRKDGFDYIIVDLAETPPVTETVGFPMELLKKGL